MSATAAAAHGSGADQELKRLARRCADALTELSNHAKGAQFAKHRIKYLEKINDPIAKLSIWRDGIGEGPYGDSSVAIQPLADLRRHIAQARDELAHHLSLRRMVFRCFTEVKSSSGSEQRIDNLLGDMDDIIGTLNGLTPIIHPPRPVDPHRFGEDSDTSAMQDAFRAFFLSDSANSKEKRDILRIGSIDVMWAYIKINPELEYHVRNSADPGHGKKYPEIDFSDTRKVLTLFGQVCANVLDPNERLAQRVKHLSAFNKICVILKHINREVFLDGFIDQNLTELPLSIDVIRTLCPHQSDHPFVSEFYAEQHRLGGRRWPRGETVYIDSSTEPLPFKNKETFAKQGTFGIVQKVQDVFTKEKFAHKRQADESDYVRNHFFGEIARLRKLQSHKHVVKLYRAYCIGGSRYGLLVHAGDDNLDICLTRLSKKEHIAGPDFRSALLRSVGCLGHGMAYVHDNSIRHKDIKPDNIIHEFVSGSEHNFFWIDFGVAQDFSNDINSREKAQRRYTPRYAAPEVMRKVKKLESQPPPVAAGGPHRSRPTSEDVLEAPDDLVWGIGRKADVFSCGVTYLEIASVLVGESHETSDVREQLRNRGQRPKPDSFEACHPFHKHTQQLKTWATNQMLRLQQADPSDLLVPLFELCIEMINFDPVDRPTMDTVVQRLADASRDFFCADCQRELDSSQGERATHS